MPAVFAIVASYLIGSVSFSYMIAKWIRKIDIRTVGSGNAGATNTLRVMGLKPALAVLALDIAKGIAAVWIGRLMSDGNVWIPVLCGIAVIVGHNWPVFFGFRGGKGVAAAIGVLATLHFFPSLYAGLIAIAAVALTRYVSLGSLIFTTLTPVFLLVMDYGLPYVAGSALIFVLAAYRHRTNIARLIRGQEHKLSFGGKAREG